MICFASFIFLSISRGLHIEMSIKTQPSKGQVMLDYWVFVDCCKMGFRRNVSTDTEYLQSSHSSRIDSCIIQI